MPSPVIFIKINAVLYPQRVSLTFKFELAGLGVGACSRLLYNEGLASFKFEKSAPNGHYGYFLHRAATPDQIIQQNSWYLQRERGPLYWQ